MLVTNLITTSDNLSKAITKPVAPENILKLNGELSKINGLKINGLSRKDCLKAARMIVCQPEVIDLFFIVPNDDKGGIGA